MIDTKLKTRALVQQAKVLVGTVEVGGNNHGPLVERFQKAVDGKAEGEPWCVAFVQFCVKAVDELFIDMFGPDQSPNNELPQTESTQELWRASAPLIKRVDPDVGSIVVWQSLANPALGHCGIVTGTGQNGVFTIEGNTGAGNQRDGDGVWTKLRTAGDVPGFRRLGYIRPWG